MEYSAPESLAIDLDDTSAYPGPEWIRNDLSLRIADGDMVVLASARCPIDAHPQCQPPPAAVAVRDQLPFDDGVLIPLEIAGPARSFAWWSGIKVLGATSLGGRSAIQLETTVAGADLIRAITDRGAWRELHPTDRVLMWLDEATLVPIRIEVFAARSPERDLWQIRRGYTDDDREPIFIIEISDLKVGPTTVEATLPLEAGSGGFIDGPSMVPELTLPTGFVHHRKGHWSLPSGGQVEVASWSDGRAWLMVQATDAWTEPRLFGMSLPFVRPVGLGAGSVGYMSPDGDQVSIHTPQLDVVISGSVPELTLIEAASSIRVGGQPVPDSWPEASIVAPEELPPGTLVPGLKGWSVLGITEGERTTLLLTGGGSRRVLIQSDSGDQLDPPTGPDVAEVRVRGSAGRFDAAATTLEWVEDDRVIQMRSQNVSLDELLDLAASMAPR